MGGGLQDASDLEEPCTCKPNMHVSIVLTNRNDDESSIPDAVLEIYSTMKRRRRPRRGWQTWMLDSRLSVKTPM